MGKSLTDDSHLARLAGTMSWLSTAAVALANSCVESVEEGASCWLSTATLPLPRLDTASPSE